jgi:hypothetical protein
MTVVAMMEARLNSGMLAGYAGGGYLLWIWMVATTV